MPHTSHRKGFTLIEILIVIGITGVLLGLLLANYQRGSDDSILQREATLLGSRLRLAQSQTAAGTNIGYCSYESGGNVTRTGTPCTSAGVCGADGVCNTSASAVGGFALTFSCGSSDPNSVYNNALTAYPTLSATNARSAYYAFADQAQCTAGGSSQCYPADTASKWVVPAKDHTVSYVANGSTFDGDTLEATYTLDPKVQIANVEIAVDAKPATPKYSCAPPDLSAWAVAGIPHNGLAVNNNFPLQATVAFDPPDGRRVYLSDNVSTADPVGNNWGLVRVMLQLKNRPTDCRVISITSDGVVTQSVNATCTF